MKTPTKEKKFLPPLLSSAEPDLSMVSARKIKSPTSQSLTFYKERLAEEVRRSASQLDERKSPRSPSVGLMSDVTKSPEKKPIKAVLSSTDIPKLELYEEDRDFVGVPSHAAAHIAKPKPISKKKNLILEANMGSLPKDELRRISESHNIKYTNVTLQEATNISCKAGNRHGISESLKSINELIGDFIRRIKDYDMSTELAGTPKQKFESIFKLVCEVYLKILNERLIPEEIKNELKYILRTKPMRPLKKIIDQHEKANADFASWHAERIRPTFDQVAEAQQKTVTRARHIFARQKGLLGTSFLDKINGYDVKLPKESSIKKIGVFSSDTRGSFEKVGIAIKNRIDELRSFEDCIVEREAHLKSMLTNAMMCKYGAVYTAIQNIKRELVVLEELLEQNAAAILQLQTQLKIEPNHKSDLKHKNWLIKQLEKAKKRSLPREDSQLLKLQNQIDEVNRRLTMNKINMTMRNAAQRRMNELTKDQKETHLRLIQHQAVLEKFDHFPDVESSESDKLAFCERALTVTINRDESHQVIVCGIPLHPNYDINDFYQCIVACLDDAHVLTYNTGMKDQYKSHPVLNILFDDVDIISAIDIRPETNFDQRVGL